MTPRGRQPGATYRFQLRPGFGFAEVAALAGYLADLGIEQVYLSPVLAAVPGSAHGYDVVDHDRISEEAGGAAGLEQLAATLAAHGLGLVADLVPNHMAVPAQSYRNRALWSLLREGPVSPFAAWFDVDWSGPDRAVLLPVLGERIGTVLARGELRLQPPVGEEPTHRLCYQDHVFPVRPGTEHLDLPELVEAQWYRLAWWRVGDEALNYRRFFDIDSLVALRVEDEAVFRASHRLILDLVRRGLLTGLRIDHIDGLADPAGYLRRLAAAAPDAWVVVEKILARGELLPADWACAGTTGYDALAVAGGLFADPAAAAELTALLAEQTGDPAQLPAVTEQARREVIAGVLYTEVHRLVELLDAYCHNDIDTRDHTPRMLHRAVTELLLGLDRYRAYVVPGQAVPEQSVTVLAAAADVARGRLTPDLHECLDLVRDLALDRPVGRRAATPGQQQRRREFAIRFQQTSAPVMAKGVEDRAFYRWHLLDALCDVGSDPAHLGVAPEEFHAFAARLQRDWPTTMTTLSTHDTKRSEDVRARLFALTEFPQSWADTVRACDLAAAPHQRGSLPDPALRYSIWQTLVGAWQDGPLPGERLTPYLVKAAREAAQHTSWTRPDAEYEAAVTDYALAVLADRAVISRIAALCAELAPAARVAILGQKLVQLLMPGVPDLYQGCELVDLSLVDPDNRRPVDYPRRAALLAGQGCTPVADHHPRAGAGDRLDAEKLALTAACLRLRRERPVAFGPDGGYHALPTSTGNALAFARGGLPEVVAVATRLPVALARHGGWGDHTVSLPDGRWLDRLTGAERDGGQHRLASLLDGWPVAVLENLAVTSPQRP